MKLGYVALKCTLENILLLLRLKLFKQQLKYEQNFNTINIQDKEQFILIAAKIHDS